MRLIHCRRVAFQEFVGDDIPHYAIVSHRWGKNEDEVSHQDFLQGKQSDHYGWTKILKGCEIAQELGYEWLWIDTCCIDKKSSAELSEAINSMFTWYHRSMACLVFLHDVPPVDPSEITQSYLPKGVRSQPVLLKDLRCSSWFKRGWTLQELIAPRRIEFYNSSFEYIGDPKADLAAEVAAITGIRVKWLNRNQTPANIHRASIAERMKWASLRFTTRLEDAAYSLIGLFDVNMPLLYGEGTKAFMRLQLEIIRKYDDESVFAWFCDSPLWQGLLAPSPLAFRPVGNGIIQSIPRQARPPFSMTNKGLQITLHVPQSIKLPEYGQGSVTVLFPLNCEEITLVDGDEQRRLKKQLAIRLNVKTMGSAALNMFEARPFRGKRREDQLILTESFFDLPSKYGCLCIEGMPNKKEPLKAWNVYIEQDGL